MDRYPHRILRRIALLMACLLLPLVTTAALAEEAGILMRIPSARADAKIPVFVHTTEGAKATVILLPGGSGGIGKLGESGWPSGGNFLVRSAQLFARSGLNVNDTYFRPPDIG